jgi:rfaE bifunctional protein nucleotidyltransferase chain/domain
MNAIEAHDVRKIYRRYGRRKQFATLKSALLSGSLVRDLKPDTVFEALKGVTFEVAKGKTFGIVGRNGSGKSTMLKMIAGIGKPTSGTVRVDGRVSALIELGAGFHPEISGRENVYINGLMLGLSRREIARRFDDIVRFAELEDFIDAPVKTYSSGMYMRLGFAVAINVDPDVLLVDEVLAVGDEAFTHKCLDKFAEFRRRGRTVLLVTHSLDLVTRFCDQAIWLDGGVAKAQGDPKRVIDAYLMEVASGENRELSAASSPASHIPNPPDMFQATEGRWGSQEVEITAVDLIGASGQPSHVFQSGERVDIRLRVHPRSPITDFAFGVGIFNAEGVCCYGTNTMIDGGTASEMSGDGEVTFTVDELNLVEGTYKLDVAVHRQDGVPYDYHRLLYTFRVKSPLKDVGIFRPPHRWAFTGAIHVTGLDKDDEGSGTMYSIDAAAALAERVRGRGGKIVFTNGVFDLLHPGHVRYLQEARSLGDALIVGINSDRSVHANKGPERPITPAAERAEVLLALECIDAVAIFDEETPAAIIERIEPDVLVKGADWGPGNIVGRATVEARGGRVVRMELSQGYSTTELIRRVRSVS